MIITRSVALVSLTAWATIAGAAPDAQVSVNLGSVTHANAPLQWGMSVDARSSFTFGGNPTGYYSPTDGTPLAIGQQWEDDFRQTALRYPLGPINVWDWKATVGPVASRPVQSVPGIGQKAAFGLDEYLKMAERNGVSGDNQHILINIYGNINNPDMTQAAQSAADLVEYLNMPAGQGYAWADLRAQYNPDHPQPYGIGIFNLGNEPWAYNEYDFRTTGTTSDGAIQHANDMIPFTVAMRTVDPTIRITAMAAGPKGPMEQATGQLWDLAILNVLGPHIDGLSVNIYYDSESPEIAFRGVGPMEQYIDQLSVAIDTRGQELSKPMTLMIGEHAHAIDIDYSTTPPTNTDPDLPMQWQGAVTTADFMMMLSQKDVERAHFFIWGNGLAVWHPIRYDGTDIDGNQIMTVLPTASLYDVLGDLIEENALEVTVTNLAGNSSDNISYSVRAGAFLSDDASMLRLMLVNRDPTLAHTTDLSTLAGYLLTEGLQLTGDDPLAESMQITSLGLTPGQSSFSLPALSVTVLSYHIVPEPTMTILLPLAGLALRRRRR
jgi:hypothetical protein